MAEESLNQPLKEFVRNCIDDLTSSSLSPNEAYVAMQQYAPLRTILKDQKEINKDSLLKILSKEQELLGEGVKYAEELDRPMSPAEITARAELFTKAQQQIPQAARLRFEQERKTYARRVAQAWIKNTKVNIAEQQLILESVENLPPTTSAAETKNLVANQLQNLTQTNPNLSRGQTVIAQIAQTTDLAEPTQIRQQIFNTILDHPDADQSILLGLAAQGVDIQRAAQLADLGKVFSANIDPAITLPITDDYGRPIFFRAIAKTPVQKIAAPFLDTAFALVSPDKRPDIIKELFSDPLGRVTQKLGAAIVEQPLYKQAIDQANRAFTGRPSYPGGVVIGIGKVVADVGKSVFGEPINQEILQLIEVEKRVTIEQRIAWDWRHVYAGTIHTQGSSPFSFAFDGAKWILGFAGKKAAGAAIKQGGKWLATKGIGKIVGGFFGSFAAGPIGTFIGSVIGDKIIGGLLRGVGSLLNIGGGFITRLMSGDTSNLPLPETIMAAVVLAPIILIFLLPTFLNPQFIGHTAQSSALADIGGGGGEEFTPGPANPFASSCGWPISGTIVQGPFMPGYSHHSLNAVDFDAPNGTPIYAVLGGTITTMLKKYGIGDEDRVNGGYGNYMVINGVDKGGNQFQTIYGHLADFASGITRGTIVKECQLIAYSDDNGYSFEPHLHFEYNGGGRLDDPQRTILPYAVPPCSNASNNLNCRTLLGSKDYVTTK